jgi:hypothetical protein
MSQNFGDEQSAAHCNVPSVHRTASLDASRHSAPAVSIASDSENEETIESLGESLATGPWRSILFLPETAESATCSELAWGRGEAPGDQKREIDCSRCEIVAHRASFFAWFTCAIPLRACSDRRSSTRPSRVAVRRRPWVFADLGRLAFSSGARPFSRARIASTMPESFSTTHYRYRLTVALSFSVSSSRHVVSGGFPCPSPWLMRSAAPSPIQHLAGPHVTPNQTGE